MRKQDMVSIQKLKTAVREGLGLIMREKSLIEGTVYASANRRVIGRLVYTHHFPCQGLQEPKSEDDLGVSVQGYFNHRGKKVVGFGHVANDIGGEAVARALERARANAVYDPDFHGFPNPARERTPRGAAKPAPDQRLLALAPEAEARLLADMSFKTLEGAFAVFKKFHRTGRITDPDFIVSGDNFLITEKMAVASTNGVTASEENTVVLNLLSAMIEGAQSKGRGWGVASKLGAFDPSQTGEEAATQAVRGVGGETIESGTYRVVFGPQAATEIFANLLLGSFNASMLDFRLSPFNGEFGKMIASPLLSLADDPTYPGGAGSKAVTDEGFLTARNALIENGRFTGMLQNDYYRKKLLRQTDAELEEKIGPYARTMLEKQVPRSGFRFGGGGGRVAYREPGISATNLFISSSKPVSRNELFKKVKDGIYIGALWYTYPIAGYKAGEITGTAVADTFRIKNGKLAEPIRVNSIRIHANMRDLIKNIIGITPDPRPTILWASDEITYAPEVGISGVQCEAIRHDEA